MGIDTLQGLPKTRIGLLSASSKYASYHFRFRANGRTQQFKPGDILCTEEECRWRFHSPSGSATFIISARPDSSLSLSFIPDQPFKGEWEMNFCFPFQHIGGMGEQFSVNDFAGKKVHLFTEEQGLGRGDQPVSLFTGLAGVSGNKYSSYASWPFFFNERGQAAELLTYLRPQLNFSKKNKLQIRDFSDSFSMVYYPGRSVKHLLSLRARRMGSPLAPPDWALGNWLGLQGGTGAVSRALDSLRNAGAEFSAIWIQDWCGRRDTRFGSQLWWTWTADSRLYPDLPKWIRQQNEKNIHVLGYINSFLAESGKYYNEALEKGYLVRNNSNEVYRIKTGGFPAVLIDLFNPEAYAWTKNIIRRELIDAGFSGWMADYGEWLPADARIYGDRAALPFHNQYADLWAQCNKDAVADAGKTGEIVFFSRSGSTLSSSIAPLFWCGDQMTDYGQNDGMPSALTGMLTSAASGMIFNHADLGGYTGFRMGPLLKARDPELLRRWIEMAAFMPFFRSHEGLRPGLNAQVYEGGSQTAHYARFTRIRNILHPLFKSLTSASVKSGVAAVAPAWVHHPEIDWSWKCKDSYFLGEDIFAAPFLHPGSVRKVQLPPGDWLDLWSGKAISENRFRTTYKRGYPPVFIRASSSSDLNLILQKVREVL